jgi:hypothetical protein
MDLITCDDETVIARHETIAIIAVHLTHATLELALLWRNGMCGLKDHDCKARIEIRQGREGAIR